MDVRNDFFVGWSGFVYFFFWHDFPEISISRFSGRIGDLGLSFVCFHFMEECVLYRRYPSYMLILK